VTSPMMIQWHACKKQAGDALLLFRLGDFYEAFYDDALTLARDLDLTLTKRQDIPMAGVPAHSADGYIDRLVGKGHKVAVAEQLEDPSQTKGIVRREIVRIVTPGTLVNSELIEDKSNNYLSSLTKVGSFFGLATLDLTTASFVVFECESEKELLNELGRLRPSELVTSHKFLEKQTSLIQEIKHSLHPLISGLEEWRFDHQIAHDVLASRLKVRSLDGFGLKGLIASINAAGALLVYVEEILRQPIHHITSLSPYSTTQFLSLDQMTQRNLELTESLIDGSRRHTLLEVLDKTETPMGGRLLRKWIKQPLLQLEKIIARQEAIAALLEKPLLLQQIPSLLASIRDLERLIMKIATGYAGPRDVAALRHSLDPLPALQTVLQSLPAFERLTLRPLPELVERIASTLVDEPPLKVTDGHVIRDQFSPELDELRQLKHNHQRWMADYQNRLREETKIKTLKVGYTRVSGFYIEVSRGQSELAPLTFQRRQTLANAERFITPELKEFEEKILHAEERILQLETSLFNALREAIIPSSKEVLENAATIAEIDALVSLASVARHHHYCRPVVDNSEILEIKGGRHPVIEATLVGESFVPNDLYLDQEKQRLMLLTGPNMAGKSTYIRQAALLTLMAQIGSYIPAQSARVGLIDKIFTRVGASDDLARGHSTFMVEMTETANILNNATSRSLVILDEIGRGTSTYDGISIAWSVAEHLLTTEGKQAKTLFATHYWELTKLEEKVPGAINYTMAVHESGDVIRFLRKVIRGGSDKSYGIHVGRLAGLPKEVISRAQEILIHLEENANRKSAFEPSTPRKRKVVKNTLQLELI